MEFFTVLFFIILGIVVFFQWLEAQSSEPKVNPQPKTDDIDDIKPEKKQTDNDTSQADNDVSSKIYIHTALDADTVVYDNSLQNRCLIRLAGIDAPEMDQPWGYEAWHWFKNQVEYEYVQLECFGKDPHGRQIAFLLLKKGNRTINLNYELVRLGHAWVYHHFRQVIPDEDYQALCQLEKQAKVQKLGLWQDPHAIAPWQWRKKRRS